MPCTKVNPYLRAGQIRGNPFARGRENGNQLRMTLGKNRKPGYQSSLDDQDSHCGGPPAVTPGERSSPAVTAPLPSYNRLGNLPNLDPIFEKIVLRFTQDPA